MGAPPLSPIKAHIHADIHVSPQILHCDTAHGRLASGELVTNKN